MTQWNFHKGQKLLIELAANSYSGDFLIKSHDNSRIDMVNVRGLVTGGPILSDRQTFYASEILSIKIFADSHESNDAEQLNISKSAFSTVEETIQNYQYIQQTDSHYHNAINDLKTQDYVGVNLENDMPGRLGQTSLLVMTTSKNIYLFDILCLGSIFPELKRVLESRYPRKIVHNGRTLVDNLKHTQNIQLQPVFDTFVAHVAITKAKESISIEECVNYHFNLTLKKEVLVKLDRPLREKQKLMAARHAAFLIKLHGFLVHKVMLKNIYAG
jgi:uncharacterized protein (DUF1778 family)